MVDQDVMKTSNIKEEKVRKEESRFVKVKRMLTETLIRKTQTQAPTNYEEAKNLCKARKRKERQESTGSVSQERKVIRSNSEERVDYDGREGDIDVDIRRVVSHEDFQKVHPLQEHNDTILISLETNGKNSPPGLAYDDYERRRHHERFAPALVQKGRRNNAGRKYKNKHFSKPRTHKDENSNSNLKSKTRDFCAPESEIKLKPKLEEFIKSERKESSSSPLHTPVSSTLDLTTLHQQIDSSEPMPSSSSQEITDQTETLPSLLVASNRLLSSPRNSIMVTHRIYLDPNIQQTKSSLSKELKSPLDKKLKHFSKQINTLKRKIKKQEEEFQATFGYKPSQADKMNDKGLRKLCFDLGKLKKEYKQLKGDALGANGAATFIVDGDDQDTREQSIYDTLTEIEKKLREKRVSCERSSLIEEMNNHEIAEEKVAVQKALLYLESKHGRPSSKEDRNLVRPLYDRYRTLKRMMNGGAINELATIHEHEAMNFVSSPTQASENDVEKLNPSASTDSDTDISLGEGLHNLTLDELLQEQRDMNEEKKKLKRSLKEFESEFQIKTGRKLQKDDKVLMATVYTFYKQTKAKLRLIDALIAKQVASKH